MRIIRRNPETNNYDIDITAGEWKDILRLPAVQHAPNLLVALEKWYKAPAQTSSCKQLARQYGLTHQFFSIQNVRLGRLAVRHLARFRLVGANGRETYWPVAWLELSEHHGEYTMQLRPELVEAIRQLGIFD